MRFLSVCSGIEAASVAWNPLGWEAVAFSEIEPFPCAVLAHHYPSVPNWGDMTKFQEWPDADVDLLCGGTPCQSFSVAGLRKGLADPRGNLMLTFGAIAAKYRPRWLVWENVPGVLSSNGGRDFGAFLGMLGQLGYGFAYRVLDAQYFGVPQRRRRVFVVGCLGDWRRAAAVLFERHSLSGDSAPSREAGEGSAGRAEVGAAIGFQSSQSGVRLVDAHATLDANNGSRRHNGVIQNQLGAGVISMAHGQGGAEIGLDRGPTLTCNHEAPIAAYPAIAFNARQDPDHWHDRTGPLDTDGGTQAVSYAIQAGALRTNPASGPDGVGVQADHAYTLEARAEVQAVAFAENSRAEVRLEGGDGQRCGALSAGGGKAGQGVPMALQCSLPETLYNKGFNAMEEGNASTQETYPGTLLRTLRQEAGEEAFAKWGLGILDSLQQAEVLRQALHGIGIRPATFSRSWVVCCALGFPVYGSGWLLQSLREAGCERCSSQGWEPSEQLAGELGAYLSELSRPGAQAARFMRDLWFASEGFGLLQQALLAVQEVGRPASRKGQSVLRGSEGRGAEIPEDVSSARMQREAPRERVLHEARAAGEARDYRNGATEQERSGKGWVGEAPLAVRRLVVEECEFLQGFPRGYSKIPWRNKPASECPDGPRYKALGNSWAVPCVTWIGQRIAASIE